MSTQYTLDATTEVSSLVLRDYQSTSVEALRDRIRQQVRALMYYLPTGGGKSLILAFFAMAAYRKGRRVFVVVDRRVLVEQISATFYRYGIPHGIVMAGMGRYDPESLIHVASVQTLEAMGMMPAVDMICIDEAHIKRASIFGWMKAMPRTVFLGVSATPTTDGLAEGGYDKQVVVGGTTNRLVADGHLVMPIFYAAKPLDMTGAKTVAGEWSDAEVEERGLRVVGDVVSEVIQTREAHFPGRRPKMIGFSATVDHGRELCRQFNERGLRVEQISYKDTDDDRRRELIDEFKRPSSMIDGLVSVEALTRGFDVVDIEIGFCARPLRKSFSTHIQMLGRIMRPAPGKRKAYWLDFGGNVLRFWDDMHELFEHGVTELDDKKLADKPRPEPDEKTIKQVKCQKCGYILPPRAELCPACGHKRQRMSMVENVAGTMVLVGSKAVPATGKYAFLADRDSIWRQLSHMALDKYDGDVDRAQKYAQAKYHGVYGEFARRRVDPENVQPPCKELAGRITHDNIAYARRRVAA
ncbi:MAG: DEAD/DEAH box helicase family protein [Lautropia sp.]